jgi:surfeit locus 1 family protein
LLQVEFDARAAERPVALNAVTRDADLLYRLGIARGSWHRNGEIFLDNKVSNGVAGYHVITPLQLADSNRYILVNRGWIRRGPAYPQPPTVPVANGGASGSGVLVQPSARFVELSDDRVQDRVWQNLTIERYRQATGLDILPYVLLAAATDAPLQPIREHPSAGADKHTEYMFTWYALAVTVVILWVALNLVPAIAADTENENLKGSV